MSKPKYSARVDNIYFLSRIGLSLRWATQGKPHDDLPADVRQLLARLDQVEAETDGQPPGGGAAD